MPITAPSHFLALVQIKLKIKTPARKRMAVPDTTPKTISLSEYGIWFNSSVNGKLTSGRKPKKSASTTLRATKAKKILVFIGKSIGFPFVWIAVIFILYIGERNNDIRYKNAAAAFCSAYHFAENSGIVKKRLPDVSFALCKQVRQKQS